MIRGLQRTAREGMVMTDNSADGNHGLGGRGATRDSRRDQRWVQNQIQNSPEGRTLGKSVDLHRIRLVTFDLDNTLWDVWPVIERANHVFLIWLRDRYPDLAERFQPSAVALARQQLLAREPGLEQQPTRFRKALMARVLAAAPEAPIDAGLARVVEEGFAVFYAERNKIELFAGALDLLEALRPLRTLIAISNGNADLRRIGLMGVFSHQLVAEHTRRPKPDPYMFEEALRLAGVRPDEALHVGDHWEEDVVAARQVGMQAIWFAPGRAAPAPSMALENPHSPARDHSVIRVGSFSELAALLLP